MYFKIAQRQAQLPRARVELRKSVKGKEKAAVSEQS
jgi:hypothetical protein